MTDENICWNSRTPRWLFDPKVDMLFRFGRCRSGRRWFWAAGEMVREDAPGLHGWEDTEAQALEAARAAVVKLAAGNRAFAAYWGGWANLKLKKVNAAKRAAAPPSDAKGSTVAEYLYAVHDGFDGYDGYDATAVRYRIAKKTKSRISYIKDGEPIDEHGEPLYLDRSPYPRVDIGYVNRVKLEADGEVWSNAECVRLYAALSGALYLELPAQERAKPDLNKLKLEMIAAHPDKGGTHAAFIAARAAYEAAQASTK